MYRTTNTLLLVSTLLCFGPSTSSQDEAADLASASEVSLLQTELHVNQVVKAGGRQKVGTGGVQNALELEQLVAVECTTGANGEWCQNGGISHGTMSGASDDDPASCSCSCPAGYSGANCQTAEANIHLQERQAPCASPFSSQRCSKCQGNCASDDDCYGSLRCFQRSSKEHLVPGCVSGGAGDLATLNYCFNPREVPEANNSLKNAGATGCRTPNVCFECQGDCDYDNDCFGHYRCFHRSSSNEIVPGCAVGGYGDVGSYDYCYDPANMVETSTTATTRTTTRESTTVKTTTTTATATTTTTIAPDFFSSLRDFMTQMMDMMFPEQAFR